MRASRLKKRLPVARASRQRAADTVEMAKILFGADFVEKNTVITSLINANSPLVWDSVMLGAARAYAEANQATLLTPFILAGAMAPVTAAGVCAQTLAEAIQLALGADGPYLVDVVMDPEQGFVPKVIAEKRPDGTIVSKPLEDMFPWLPTEEMRENMVIGLYGRDSSEER